MRKMIHIEIGEDMTEKLKNQAKTEFTTVSSLVRNILREYLGDERNKTVFSRHKKLTTLEKEIQGVGIDDKKSEEDKEFEQSLKENL